MAPCEGVKHIPGWKELEQLPAQWEIYKRLVEGVPKGIAVKDVLVGNHWSIVEAESGCGMAMNVSGGRSLAYRMILFSSLRLSSSAIIHLLLTDDRQHRVCLKIQGVVILRSRGNSNISFPAPV